MANEWTPVELYGHNNDGAPRSYNIADGDSISKGQPLALLSSRVASAAMATSVAFAGVASEDHKPGIGVTRISVWTDALFNAPYTSGGITVGWNVAACEQNRAVSGAWVVGSGLNTGASSLGYAVSTATNGNAVQVRVQL